MEQTESDEMMIIKRFMRRYGKLIVGLFVFFVVVSIGGNYWRKTRLQTATEASQIFQTMVMADIQQDTQTATAKGAQLISDYSSTPYAQFAGLILAKMAVAEGNLDKAVEKLRWVAEQKGSQNIVKHLATTRLSAVLLQQNKLDEALALVADEPDQAYVSLYAQARGDVYVAKGDQEQAKKAYMLAMQSLPQGVQSPVLQLKLLDLGGEQDA